MVEYSTIEPWQAVDENGVVFEQGGLIAYFFELIDPRHARGKRYPLETLLVLVFLAMMSGVDGPSAIADWCQARRAALVELMHLRYPKMPSHHTMRRLFADILDEERFEQRMRAYAASQRGEASAPGLLGMDGKKEHGTMPPGESQGEATLAVYDPEGEQVIAQVAIEPEQGEIPAGKLALGQVVLKDKVVLADALHTQRKLCQQVLAGGGNYVLTIKKNQPTLYQAIESLFAPTAPNHNLLDFQTVCKTNKDHGRIERRRLTALPLFPGEIDWPGIQQVFRLERKFTYLRQGRVVRVEEAVHYGLTGLTRSQANAERLLYLKRIYWQIENGLHYRRAVVYLLSVIVASFQPGGAELLAKNAGSQAPIIWAFSQSFVFAAGVAVILLGVRMFVGEIVPAFRGISEKIVPDAIPALDCPAVFPYGEKSVLMGFFGYTIGLVLAMILLLVVRFPVIIIPILFHSFFMGGTAGVFGNSTGGRRGAVIGSAVMGFINSCPQAYLFTLLAGLGFQGTTFADTDFCLTGILISWFGSSMLVVLAIFILVFLVGVWVELKITRPMMAPKKEPIPQPKPTPA